MQRDDVESALLRKGFQKNNTDHSYYQLGTSKNCPDLAAGIESRGHSASEV